MVRDWEIAGSIQQEKKAAVSVGDACDAFMADLEAQRLSDASLKKYRVLLMNPRDAKEPGKYSPSLSIFCAETGIQFTNQVTLPALTRFRGQWKDGAISGGKKLERLRAVGRFLVDQGWWNENLALKLKRPKVTDPPTMPFEREQVTALLAACDQYTDSYGRCGQDNARLLRTFLLFLRYTGLRIGDATGCSIEQLVGNKLFLRTAKTGVPVYIPLPPFLVDALEFCPRMSDRRWFWTGDGSIATQTGNWRRKFRRLCEIAGVKDGHPHRFRDTFAVELLLDGVPMERVSKLLGHSSVKVTERHYAPWVQALQNQLEADVMRAWRNDPLAQKELLRSDAAIPDMGSENGSVAVTSRPS